MTPHERDHAQRILRHLSQQIELISDLVYTYPETDIDSVKNVLRDASVNAIRHL